MLANTAAAIFPDFVGGRYRWHLINSNIAYMYRSTDADSPLYIHTRAYICKVLKCYIFLMIKQRPSPF